MLGLWPLATALPTVQVDVDLSAGTEPFQKNWQRSFGSGHALLGMRADWQAHLKRCIAELGLRGVRMHGIFDDDMSVEPARGTFYWYNVDVVLDFLVEQGVTPIVELSFMPSSIAQDTTRYAFRNRGGYKGLLSPPAAFADWYDLVLAFATHVVDRHGLGIIGRWAFEVWNEMWGMPFPSAYMPLYNASARALKHVDPSLRVGGPSSANLAHLSTFLAAAHDTRLPVDFLSSHHYPSDPSCSRSGPHAASPGCFVADVLDAAAVAEAAGKPFYLTEYKHGLQGGPGTGFGGRHGDTAYAAAFIMHTVPQLSSLHVLSWWSISDIFEENWMIGKPFYGGYGLLTVHGVAKPAFRAFQLLAGAGTRRVSSVGIRDEAPGYMGSSTISALITRGDALEGGNDLQLFLTNFGPEQGASPAPWQPAVRNVTVRLMSEAQPGRTASWRGGLGVRSPSVAAAAYTKPAAPDLVSSVAPTDAAQPPRLATRWPSSALLRRIDDASTAPLSTWEGQGSPDYPTREQVAQLHAASEMPTSAVEIRVAGSGDAFFTVELPPYGVAHVSIPMLAEGGQPKATPLEKGKSW